MRSVQCDYIADPPNFCLSLIPVFEFERQKTCAPEKRRILRFGANSVIEVKIGVERTMEDHPGFCLRMSGEPQRYN